MQKFVIKILWLALINSNIIAAQAEDNFSVVDIKVSDFIQITFSENVSQDRESENPDAGIKVNNSVESERNNGTVRVYYIINDGSRKYILLKQSYHATGYGGVVRSPIVNIIPHVKFKCATKYFIEISWKK